MLTVYNCIVSEHDLRLVALAALVCALASITGIDLLDHIRTAKRRRRMAWLLVAATSCGFGIWATHFIAMLAFAPSLPMGYNIGLTLVSLGAAVVLTGAGMSFTLFSKGPGGASLGGALIGGGIATMHYTGMAAFEIAGTLAWDRSLVAVSILIGMALGAAALPAGLKNGSMRWKLAGALLLTLAICSHHFTAMSAVSIEPDPTVALSTSAIPSSWMAFGVAVVSVSIFLLAFAALGLDLRERRRSAREAQHMRDLTDAAIEGLVLCDGGTIVSVNRSFMTLAGYGPEEISRRDLALCFPDLTMQDGLFTNAGQAVEAELRQRDGSLIPVELISRQIVYDGREHNVVAVRDLRDRKAAEAQIRFLAHHDPLTGLDNRASFDLRLDGEVAAHRAADEHLAVLCLDLDGFKEINDLYGHSTGDELLQNVAKQFSAALDEGQILARLGGDEFAIIAPRLRDPAQAGSLAERILKSIGTGDTAIPAGLVSVSLGIALYPSDGQDRTELLSSADTALYRAKTEGKGTYRFFEAAMGAQVRERRSIEHDLHQAIARGEFSLAYQPQAHIETGRVSGFEILLRWKHPERGDVSPAVFIPIAEESGLILKIGEWVLREACREAAGWVRPLTIAVNVSALQLISHGFSDLVRSVLAETGLPPHRLEIEITETALIRDPNRALQTLNELKALGLSLAMDDFGTGYSSLSNLRAFPFDKIKIDQSFIRAVNTNPQAAAIVRAVLGLGRGLGLPVIAEGVETAEELSFLGLEGCSEAQGYLLGRPAAIAEHSPLIGGNVIRMPKPALKAAG